MIDKKIILLFYFVISNICNAQYFNNNYDLTSTKDFFNTPIYCDSSIYVDGVVRLNSTTSGYMISKMNLNGDTIFVRKYLRDSTIYFGGYGNTLTRFKNSLYAIGVYTKTSPLVNIAYIQKYNLNGDSLGYYEVTDSLGVVFNGITTTSDDNLAITGYTRPSMSNFNVLLEKFDTLLNPLWIKTYGGGNEDVGLSVDTTSDGGFVIGGYTHSYGSGAGDAYLIKTDSLGVFQWQKTYGGIYDGDFGRVKIFNSNEIVFYGSKELNPITIPSNSNQELFLRKYYNNGMLISENLDIINHPMIVTNNIILSSNFYYFNFYYFNIDSNFVVTEIIKTDTSGNLLYSNDYTKSRSDNYSTNMIMLPDKSLVTSGYLFPDGIGLMSEDGWLFRVDSMGCFIPGCFNSVFEKDFLSDELILFPNPASTTLHLQFNAMPTYCNNIQVFSIEGKTILNRKTAVDENNILIDVSNFPNGIYFLSLQNNSAIINSKKFIINK